MITGPIPITKGDSGLRSVHLLTEYHYLSKILLKTDFAGSTKELDGNCCVTVYTGRDGCFDFYEDEGEGYDYEEGKYRLTRLTWKEADRTLSTEVMTPESQWSNIDRLYQIRKVYMVEKE